ncbi:hypothetical protein EVAR_29332_1 [Eumeta japonica]|uniref:Uncharacterized protein n=1 Tax=Eumeta variegata TaxID=151549 RepID=A0A4C1WHN8_EUMVA|nr:hypothetical protein EVAR_29332_1 [Eumeta japonica]
MEDCRPVVTLQRRALTSQSLAGIANASNISIQLRRDGAAACAFEGADDEARRRHLQTPNSINRRIRAPPLPPLLIPRPPHRNPSAKTNIYPVPGRGGLSLSRGARGGRSGGRFKISLSARWPGRRGPRQIARPSGRDTRAAVRTPRRLGGFGPVVMFEFGMDSLGN